MKNADEIEKDIEYLKVGLEKIRTRLLDQTRRNRLLNYKEAARDVTIIDEMPDQVYEHLILEKKSFEFLHHDPEELDDGDEANLFEIGTDEPDRTLPISTHSHTPVAHRYTDNSLQTPFSKKDLERRLRRLYLEHRTIIEETGANNLYLTIGFLEWYEQRHGEPLTFRSPLMLLPVRLERTRSEGEAIYKLVFDDEALDTNYSLAEKLWHDFEITLPSLEEEELPEDYWKRVDTAIANYHKEDWKIIREMSLGLFRFNKQVMWHDLDPNRWPSDSTLLDKKVMRRVLLGSKAGDTPPGQMTGEYDQDASQGNNKDKDHLRLIRDADSSQYAALIDALKLDDGLVVEGPPGTGKSQTITNLIALALNRGLSVLFVAEKMAALEVVYKRLDEVGLGPFCLQLHGLKSNKKDLLYSIVQRINFQASTPNKLAQREKSLNQARSELINVSKALQQCVGPEGLPLYNIAWRVEKLRQGLPDNFEPISIEDTENLSFEAFEHAKNLLDDLAREWKAISVDARVAWQGFLPENYSENRESDVIDSLKSARTAIQTIDIWLKEHNAHSSALSLFEVTRLLKLGQLNPSEAMPPLPAGVDSEIIFSVSNKDLLADFEQLLKMVNDYIEVVGVVNHVFDYASPEAESFADQLNTHIKRLANVVCSPETRINGLEQEKKLFDNIIANLKSIPELSTPAAKFMKGHVRTISETKKISKLASQLANGPTELSLHATLFHIKVIVDNYYNEALDAAKKLEKRAVALSDDFHLERVRDTSEFRDAYETVIVYQDKWFPIFSSKYRHAKRAVRRVLCRVGAFSRKPVFLDLIQKAVDYCTARDKFNSNQDFQIALGSLFKGVETNWDVLADIIKFSQKLRKKLGTEHAKEILSDWDAHVERMMGVSESIDKALFDIHQFSDSHPFPKSMWERPTSEIVSRLEPWSEKLAAAIESIAQPWCSGNVSLVDALKAVEQFRVARIKEKNIEEHPAFSDILGPAWEKSTTNESLLTETYDWLQNRLAIPGINFELLQWLFDENKTFRWELFMDLTTEAQNFHRATVVQFNFFESLGKLKIEEWVGGHSSLLGDFNDKLLGCSSTVSSLVLMQRWQAINRLACDLGLSPLAEAVSRSELDTDNAGMSFEYSVYANLLENCINKNPVLESFGHTRYEGLRERFAQLDKELLSLNSDEIACKLKCTTIPEGVRYGPVSNYSELGLLMQEAGKKRRHIPIRQLVRRSNNAIQALKPCFMMSPLSVAQYLPPGEIEFDLVVMDEASQLRPEDALGAIARARKAIIVGDPKQLPPTSFFDTAIAEDDDAEETIVDDTESILDVCLKQLPFRRLRWHYRSQHESLIQFSNDNFYDGDLIVFPSPKPESRDFGVNLTFIEEPSYRNGRNRNEASVVVQNIIHHFHRHNKKSLGIAAFNKRQAEEIELLLDRARIEDPALDRLINEHCVDEPLFIKNLENVQGDERDVIFISTTYGPENRGGPVFQRFGPINSDLGWRRLNVIATRAKQRVEVFTSLRPTDIRIGENSSRGVRAFRDYLEYAATGRITERGDRTGRGYDSEFEEAVSKILEDLGYQCDPQIGVAGFFIDLGVVHPDRPGEYLLGIECDGAAYHSSKSVRDRDRLRQEILVNKGWYIHRIWSTSWFHTRATEIERLKTIIVQRLDEDRRVWQQVEDFEEAKEVLTEIRHVSAKELAEEAEEVRESLEESLNRYWTKNIQPQFPDRSKSVLSEIAILALASDRPTTQEEWFQAVPMVLRQKMNPKELPFLDEIFDVIAEYA